MNHLLLNSGIAARLPCPSAMLSTGRDTLHCPVKNQPRPMHLSSNSLMTCCFSTPHIITECWQITCHFLTWWSPPDLVQFRLCHSHASIRWNSFLTRNTSCQCHWSSICRVFIDTCILVNIALGRRHTCDFIARFCRANLCCVLTNAVCRRR